MIAQLSKRIASFFVHSKVIESENEQVYEYGLELLISTFNGEVKNTNDSVIFSKYGDIVIDSTNVNLNGLVYAPFGSVEVKAMNLNLNNVVIIADSITFDCPSVNANYSSNAADFVGTVSEPLNIPKDEWQYMKDENENGLPDFFEDFDNWEKLADTDGDGLPDSIEEYLSSDPSNTDTDGDGLNDYYEVFGTYTDPTKSDSDGNGVNDGDEDFDDDGLTNLEEFLNNTYPYSNDSDNDGDEVKNYGTNPLVADTDGDGLEDGDEIILGTDPLVQDTDGDGVIDSKEKFQQSFTHKVKNEDCAVTEVVVDMECTGNINRTTTVESIMGVDYLCSEVVGLVGEPFEIETTSEFDTATLTFSIDKSKLGETEFDNLLFLWYNEEDDEFVELETILDEENSTASIVTTHFSKYMIVDSLAWFNAWRNAPDYRNGEEYSAVDTVITIDLSQSMTYSRISQVVKAAQNYISTMRDGDRIAIVTFNNSAVTRQGLTGDKELLLSALKCLKGTGGTYYNQAVKQTIDAFDMSSSNTKIAIFMSDGEPSDGEPLDKITTHTLNLISSSGVIFHTVGYGSKFNSLRTLSDAGTGTVYTATNVDELIEAYEDIYLFSGISTVDNDGDGLYDVFEKNGMTLSNGKVIFTDPFKNDTDGDGLVDGLEVLLKKFDYSRHSYVFELKTDPFASDYSNSGICDYDRVNSTNIYGKSYYVSSLNGDIIDIPVGTVAYGYPNTSCGEAFTAKAVDQYFQYRASALIYANGEYWIKVFSQNEYDVWGYIKYSDIMPSKHADLVIEKYKKYNMKLDFHNFYKSGHAYKERNVFIDNPEYQGFLMALTDVYPGTSKYNELGYVLDGFVLIGICFGESNAGAYNRANLFGSTQGIGEEAYDYGEKIVIDAMICCGIASSIVEAKSIIQNDDNDFYVQAAKMIGHLEIGLTFDKIDLSANYTSYCTAYANAANWRKCYNAHIFERENYAFYYYSKQQLLNLLDEKIISICSIITERE